MEWELNIGLETHVQLSTKSKIFSDSRTLFNVIPNMHIDAVDLALPGSLPILNSRAVEMAIYFGIAVKSNIAIHSCFERKHYFYPDLPKGYQISQFKSPILRGGFIHFFYQGQEKTIELERAHLEEDAGKSIHNDLGNHETDKTGIDLNRAGLPLLEIVSKPDMQSAEEVVSYAKALHSLVKWLEICDGIMEHGSFRCDLNISVKKKGSTTMGVRTEVKNINSFKFLEKAILFESKRQIGLLENGKSLIQETRLYDSNQNRTYRMRDKEDSHDYLYFPDPDLPVLQISEAWIKNLSLKIPELPSDRCLRFEKQFNLSKNEASKLILNRSIADYFESVAKKLAPEHGKACAKWILNEVPITLKFEKYNFSNFKVSSEDLAKLILCILDRKISNKNAREIFKILWGNGKHHNQIDSIIESYHSSEIRDDKSIDTMVKKALLDNPSVIEDYYSGKQKALNSLIGYVMRLSNGKAEPQKILHLIKEKLKI